MDHWAQGSGPTRPSTKTCWISESWKIPQSEESRPQTAGTWARGFTLLSLGFLICKAEEMVPAVDYLTMSVSRQFLMDMKITHKNAREAGAGGKDSWSGLLGVPHSGTRGPSEVPWTPHPRSLCLLAGCEGERLPHPCTWEKPSVLGTRGLLVLLVLLLSSDGGCVGAPLHLRSAV